jgi:pyruvate dehydrogenase E2 component (dihydrolipoyllysine-residue acetyltransferase)
VTDFTLPELGENITSGDVLRILVKPGDTIAKDQPVIELETDKATIEVPSSVAGQVKEIKVKAGEKVSVGQAILSIEDGAAAPEQKAPVEQEAPSERKDPPDQKTPSERKDPPDRKTSPEQEAAPEQNAPPEETASADAASSTARAPAAAAGEPPAGDQAESEIPDDGSLDQHVDGKAAPAADKPESKQRRATGDVKAVDDSPAAPRGQKVVDISRGSRAATESPAAPARLPAAAAPQVRRMARELGVEINDVAGTGPGGRISTDDVKAHVSRLVSGAVAGGATQAAATDFTRWGVVERQPMRGVRRKTAQHLSLAWSTIPHVTQHEHADITELDQMRHQYAKQVEAAGGNLTVTAILVKVVAAALQKFPQFNSSVDMAAEEIVYKKYVNIGVAVDTERGLLVPVIRDADSKNVTSIAVELARLSEKAREAKLTLEEMQGGCFSISNLGGIGGTAFTPIVNAPEVAILGVSRARTEPVYRADQFVPRLMLPLSLSYDHRVIDGADGIRFLRWIVEALEQPFLIALQG